MPDPLRVFVASSSEQIETANEVATALRSFDELDVHVWEEDVFDFSVVYIESLEQELERADFAVVLLTADDAGTVRDETVNLPRDNVIFELGLFTGRLGRERCFFFVDADSDTRIASDLSGVKPVKFYRGGDPADRRRPGLETQAEKVKSQMRELGERYKTTPEIRRSRDELWRFSSRLSGHWWERMRRGEDDLSALSYVTATVHPATNTPKLKGPAYDADGKPLADWWSVATDVVLGDQPTVYYRWEGEHDGAHGQIFGGGGEMVFDDHRLASGSGYFYDTNFALVSEGALTRVKHFGLYRCTPDEVEAMQEPWSRKALDLIRSKLDELSGR